MASRRDQLMKTFMAKRKLGTSGDPFGPIGNLSPGQRIQRGRDGSKIYEDDPDYQTKKRNVRRHRG